MKVTTDILTLACVKSCVEDGIKVMLASNDYYKCFPIGQSKISATICEDFNSTQIPCPEGNTNGKCVKIGVFPTTIGGEWLYQGMYTFENAKLLKSGNSSQVPAFADQTVKSSKGFSLSK